MVTYKLQNKTIYKEEMGFQNICLYETDKTVVSARAMSSDVRWRRIFHESIHVLRETWDT